MPYEIEFTDGPFDVVVTLTGHTSWDELAGIDPVFLADPRFRTGMSVLYDYSALEPTGAGGSEEIRAMAMRDSASEALQRVGPIAVVAAQDAVFGVSRMWLTFLDERVAARTTVVRTREDAVDWLASQPAVSI